MDGIKPKINPKTIVIVGVGIFVAIILYMIGFFIYTAGKVAVDVEYAPYAATVSLNGVAVRNHSNNYLEPGEYQLIVEYENFDKIESTVIVDEETKYLFGSLSPINEAGEEYAKKHQDEFFAVEGIAGTLANIEGEKQREKFPIISKLPVKEPYYTIGYNIEDEKLNITVESGIAYRQLAVNRVLKLMDDEDFGRYNVVFVELDNPYEGKFKQNDAKDPIEYIKTGFTDIGVDFTVGGGQEEDGYYYAYLRYSFNKYVNVVYRVVLIKDETGAWNLAGEPYPLLTTENTPGVPLEIINKVNKL